MTELFYQLLTLMETTWFVQGTWLVGLAVMFAMIMTSGWKMKLLCILLILIAIVSIVSTLMFHSMLWPAAVYAAFVIVVALGLLFSKGQAH